ncbi:MAG: DUF47 family protein [Magnetococcales bacterium]|nr:DUF47 family protein [Magnetococcales bacterium]
MEQQTKSLYKQIVDKIVPTMPDFFSMLNEQCKLVVASTEELVKFLKTGDEEVGNRVRQLEHQGDELKNRNIEVLHRSFSTPIDREDLYRAIVSLDEVMNYAKTTVREIQVLKIEPDDNMARMGELILNGTQALERGFKYLGDNNTDDAGTEAFSARKAERRTEKAYRTALLAMFEEQRMQIKTLYKHSNAEGFEKGFDIVVETFKRREIYRHLSNTADRLSHAGEILYDIIIKTS